MSKAIRQKRHHPPGHYCVAVCPPRRGRADELAGNAQDHPDARYNQLAHAP